MKKFSFFLEEKKEKEKEKPKPVILSFGRMNPPHKGHSKVVKKVHELAAKHNAPHKLVLSHLHDNKENPLEPKEKLGFCKKCFPKTDISLSSKEEPSIIQQAEKLAKQGYNQLHVVCGEDRKEEWQNLLNKYNGKKYEFKRITVTSAGKRDNGKVDVEGLSASKLRGHAKLNDFESFKKGIPEELPEKDHKSLFDAVRKGMGADKKKLKEEYKALFLIGGPGSGKDFVLKQIINIQEAKEINPNQLSEKYLRKFSFPIGTPLLVNCSALENQQIKYAKDILESIGYKTGIIYVDVSDEESRKRNYERSLKGGRVISEEVRKRKYDKSVESINEIYSLWEDHKMLPAFDNDRKNDTENERLKDFVLEFFDQGYPIKFDQSVQKTDTKVKLKKKGGKSYNFQSYTGAKINDVKGSGLGPTLDTRGGGIVNFGAGLGENSNIITLSLQKFKQKLNKVEEQVDNIAPATGNFNGAATMMPMQTSSQQQSSVYGGKKPKKFKNFMKNREPDTDA